jgi:hypothetical protein
MRKKFLPLLIVLCHIAGAQASGPKEDKAHVPELTVDQLLEKYIAAIGGSQRISQIKTIVERETVLRRKESQTYLIYRKAPDRFARFEENADGSRGTSGFDGQTYWLSSPSPEQRKEGMYVPQKVAPRELMEAAFEIHPYEKSKLRGLTRVNDRTAYVVELKRPNGARFTYYLDTETFLLLRLDWKYSEDLVFLRLARREPTILPTITAHRSFSRYYSDWRAVDGVKVPFEIRENEATRKVIGFQINADIDDSVFAPPPDSIKYAVHDNAEPK